MRKVVKKPAVKAKVAAVKKAPVQVVAATPEPAKSYRRRMYTLRDGRRVPVVEAEYPFTGFIAPTDRKVAVAGDPNRCLLAQAIRRMMEPVETYIGSGKDAYVISKPDKQYPAGVAYHFVIPAATRREITKFDRGDVTAFTETPFELGRVTPGRTLAARATMNKDRHERIKAGTHAPRPSGPRTPRVVAHGVNDRPRAALVTSLSASP